MGWGGGNIQSRFRVAVIVDSPPPQCGAHTPALAPAPPPVLASLSADQPPVKRKRGRPRKKVALIGSLESPEPPTPVNKVESQLHLVSENQLDRDLKDWWKENPEASVKVDMNVGASGLSVAIYSPL